VESAWGRSIDQKRSWKLLKKKGKKKNKQRKGRNSIETTTSGRPESEARQIQTKRKKQGFYSGQSPERASEGARSKNAREELEEKNKERGGPRETKTFTCWGTERRTQTVGDATMLLKGFSHAQQGGKERRGPPQKDEGETACGGQTTLGRFGVFEGGRGP